jgi:UDP-N-acetylglucosamine--N-acetylmuramyl-(pentapeptide) pyrophosphoryl-undecaprenol N-acetylglucosamine transferase
MSSAYALADIVVCRSGAMTVSELAAAGLPAVLVPYPYAVDDHQTANAKFLESVGAAKIIQQCDANAKKLATTIIKLSQGCNLEHMSQQAQKAAVLDADKKVADIILEVAA